MALILGMTLVFSPNIFQFCSEISKKASCCTMHCAHMFPVVKMQHNRVAEFGYFYCGPAQLTIEQCSSCWGNAFDVLCCILSLRAGNKNKAMITSGRSMI